MSFKENLLKKIQIDALAQKVISSWGPPGSGKTTLLSIISGVTEPTTGTVTARGRIAALLQLGAGFHPDLPRRACHWARATRVPG